MWCIVVHCIAVAHLVWTLSVYSVCLITPVHVALRCESTLIWAPWMHCYVLIFLIVSKLCIVLCIMYGCFSRNSAVIILRVTFCCLWQCWYIWLLTACNQLVITDLHIGWSDVTYLWSQCDRHFVSQHVVLCVVKWWRFVALLESNWISWFKKMSVLSLSYWESDIYWRQNDKHFAELAPQNGGNQLMWRNCHCHPMYMCCSFVMVAGHLLSISICWVVGKHFQLQCVGLSVLAHLAGFVCIVSAYWPVLITTY